MPVIKIPYHPRKEQIEIHKALDTNRFVVISMHRRGGKTIAALVHLIREALRSTDKMARMAFISPTQIQARRVAWDYLKNFCKDVPYAKFNETELSVTFAHGPRIMLLSGESPDALRGLALSFVVIDETAQQSDQLFGTIIRPAIADKKGKVLFISTPKGMSYFHEVYEHARITDGWFCKTYKSSETGILDKKELEDARASMSEDAFMQEFECSWDANAGGSVYGPLVNVLSDKNHITRVPYDPSVKVNIAVDLGFHDYTSIIWFQKIGRSVSIIDCYEANGEALDHYAKIIEEKDYFYDKNGMFFPHDLEVKELSTGVSRKEYLYQLGIRATVIPKMPLEDGIESLKMLLPRCYIDADNCQPLLNALRQYHRAWDERARRYRDKPVHDWSSHMCDAARIMAQSINRNTEQTEAPQQMAQDVYNPFDKNKQTIGIR